MRSLRDALDGLEMQVETKITFAFSFICPQWYIIYRFRHVHFDSQHPDCPQNSWYQILHFVTLGHKNLNSWSVSRSQCPWYFPALCLAPAAHNQEMKQMGEQQLVSSGPILTRQNLLMLASWQGQKNIPATCGLCFITWILLCSWLSGAVMSKLTAFISQD